MDELRWLQETIDGKPRNNAKGETKEKGTGAKDEINTDINIKNVLDILGSTPRNNVDEKQLATHGRLRNTMTKILKCIETLGGMVAGAASTVRCHWLTALEGY